MECRERYFMIAVDLSVAGEELRFEAVSKYETDQTNKCLQVQLRFIGPNVLLLTFFQVRITCIPSLSNTVPSMATRSRFSLFKAWWSSGHLTSALTLKTKCVQNLI